MSAPTSPTSEKSDSPIWKFQLLSSAPDESYASARSASADASALRLLRFSDSTQLIIRNRNATPVMSRQSMSNPAIIENSREKVVFIAARPRTYTQRPRLS